MKTFERDRMEQRFKTEWKKECARINRINIIATSFLIGLFSGITPMAFVYADSVRGYDGLGGEVFIPVAGFVMILALKEFFRECKVSIRNQLYDKYNLSQYEGWY